MRLCKTCNAVNHMEREACVNCGERLENLCPADAAACSPSEIDSDSVVASCDCVTKSPNYMHHRRGCKYRLISERDEAREQRDTLVAAGRDCLEVMDTTSIGRMIPARNAMSKALTAVEGAMSDIPTPRTDACTGDCRCHAVSIEAQADVCPREEMEKLERELAEARRMTEGQWLLKVAARLAADGIVGALDELIKQRDTLAEALRGKLTAKAKHAMISAYEDAMGGARLPDGDGYDEIVVEKMFAALVTALDAVRGGNGE